MEKLYPQESLPAGLDPVGMVRMMTRNTNLMRKNIGILTEEIDGLREENLMLERRLAEALSAIVDFQTVIIEQRERRNYRDAGME